MKNTFLQKLKVLKTQFQLNLIGWKCFKCNEPTESPTAKFYYVYDEQYHKYKYYLKCKMCGCVSPAFEEPKQALKFWIDMDWRVA